MAENWPCCQFRGGCRGHSLTVNLSKANPMNGINDWFENNWIDLARLLVQLAIFAALVRYGRKLLATLRASQEQVGALLRLSVSSDTAAERPAPPQPRERFEAPSVNIREPERRLEPEPEPESEPEPVFAGGYSRPSYAAEREQSLGGRLMGAQAPAFSAPAQRMESPSLTPWVSAPAMEPERLDVPAPPLPPRPNASSWLQAPMRSNGVGPWRKMVRWLKEPPRR
jgi:hypothetical protein